ncbi:MULTISPECIES: CPBP family intramembrane glutamic endopeptidase [unclassified Actinomyces]|uniref:CPBP family intramembrane glutamic endopeptidase n=1 Tax=unclassified Actinomyces TaxID=2609248 RepID=UPI000D59BB8B|nr:MULTISPECIES: CPBP family intramembrane glutamic endopeptidase [unclassified Actinomyces]RAX19530.1 CPBP family intramembrane metalloprotease [Actinomyces sp. Z5]RAX22741.1 CPBP family intramembrane metalloprotease [Actinomyces sp. Z3]
MPTTKTARLALACTIIYIAGMGVSNLLIYRVLNVGYNDAAFVKTLLPFISLLALWALGSFLALRNRLTPPDGPRRYPAFLVVFIPLVGMALYYWATHGELTPAFATPLVATVLIGFAEEMMFRRVLYVGLLQEPQGTQIRGALLGSAVVFSLLHSVNVLAGLPFPNMLLQLVTTFIAGLFYALMYDYTKSIGLMIASHFLWDYLIFSGAVTKIPVFSGVITVLNIAEFVIVVVLLTKRWQQERLSSAQNA